jgi:DNA-binding transcriptional ArsR family regulator
MNDHQAAEVAKALSHPLRIAFLRELRDRRKMSPAEFTRGSGDRLGNVSYHVSALREAGVLEVVETAKRRGTLEHYSALTGPKAGIVLGVLDMLATASAALRCNDPGRGAPGPSGRHGRRGAEIPRFGL